jgi:hypothetical protein
MYVVKLTVQLNHNQGCQMVYNLHIKNHAFETFSKALECKILVYFGTLRPFGVFCGHFVDLVVIFWYVAR